MFLLDTNILSEIVKPRPALAVVRTITYTPPSMLFGSEITRYELRFGSSLLRDGKKLWTRIESEVLPTVQWLPVDTAVALQAADLAASLRLAGRPLEWTDVLLAATGLVHSLTVVTRNTRHFERVPGLNNQNWFVSAGAL